MQESQEWKDGEGHVDRAYRKAKAAGQWDHKTMEQAVQGDAMMTDAECGVTDNLQAFFCHSDGRWNDFCDLTWEEFIQEQFERIFTPEYKELRLPNTEDTPQDAYEPWKR